MLRLVSPSGGRADVSGRDSCVSRVSRGSAAVLEATRARRRDLRAVARAAFSDARGEPSKNDSTGQTGTGGKIELSGPRPCVVTGCPRGRWRVYARRDREDIALVSLRIDRVPQSTRRRPRSSELVRFIDLKR